jgi:glyoxylase-like metal-dependent hydrolase (beta-lactamase superfamily II)
MGLKRLKTRAEIKVVAHIRSKSGGLKVNDGKILEMLDNQLNFVVIYTGIHKADHVWYFERNNHVLFVGDYFPVLKELEIMMKRQGLEPEIVLPGHGKPEMIH